LVLTLDKTVAIREVIDTLLSMQSPSHEDVNRLKIKVAAKYHLSAMISNADLIAALTVEETKQLLPILRRKTTRTISGVTVVATMTEPYPCPQPEPCAYCPGGPTQGSPQSYTGHEPAAMRGSQNNFDPYQQVKSRIEQLTAIGHKVDKIELIIMGGTFPATPTEYQTRFIQRCLDAITDTPSNNLEQAKTNAEISKTRNVGITVESRPDWAKQPHIDAMLDMGVTRIELGVQNPCDEIYQIVGRTHTVADVANATQIAKDAGLKIVYHLMPGMPGSNPQKDLQNFKKIFTDPQFKPDMIKIYPCLAINGTKAYQWLQEGKYQPYNTEKAADIIVEIKKFIPKWVRIMRVQRDIPAKLIIGGVKKSNLRQIIQEKLKTQNIQCQCIRCREVGHNTETNNNIKPDLTNIKILTEQYPASNGTEYFISAEDTKNNILLGYLRLRIPSPNAHRPEITQVPSAIVRELHVYGPLVPVGHHIEEAWQHKGYGMRLLEEAEHITKKAGLKKLLIISALGTKRYYMRTGYQHDGPYMSKQL
jgi:elongator complex protein 3